MFERRRQLQTAAADERLRLLDGQLDVNRNQMSGLVQSLLIAEDLPRKNQRLRPCASFSQPARHQQLVQAFLARLWFHFESSRMRSRREYGTNGNNGTDGRFGKTSSSPPVPLFPFVPYSLLRFIKAITIFFRL